MGSLSNYGFELTMDKKGMVGRIIPKTASMSHSASNKNGTSTLKEFPFDQMEDEIMPLMGFDDAPLLTIIGSLSRMAGIAFLFDPRTEEVISKRVTIHMTNQTASAALKYVLRENNLTMLYDENTGIALIRIANNK